MDARLQPESGNESSFVLVLFFSVVGQEPTLTDSGFHAQAMHDF
jgi:hypothetical protein